MVYQIGGDAHVYTFTFGGTVENSRIIAGKIHIHAGTLQDTVIQSDSITIDDKTVISGRVILRYSGNTPIVGNVVNLENIVLEKI